MIDRSSYEPIYQQVKRDIQEQILSGQIKIGDKLMSEAEMIRHYNVGRVTIRNALSELVAAGCLRKEQGLGTFCVAMPRQAVRKSVDVLLNTIDTYFTPYFLSGISGVLEANGYDLRLHDTMDSGDVIARLLEQCLECGTDGIIIQPPSVATSQHCAAVLERIAQREIPLITIDGRFENIDTCCLLNDDKAGGYIATKHLIDQGHTKILGLFRGCSQDALQRQAGYQQAMEAAGLELRLLNADTASKEEWVARMQQENITGIVCYNDYLAVKCYHALDKQGLRPGRDVSVVGFDDTPLSKNAIPGITTVTHPKDVMGQRAAEMILNWNGEGEKPTEPYIFTPELIQRGSVCQYSQAL